MSGGVPSSQGSISRDKVQGAWIVLAAVRDENALLSRHCIRHHRHSRRSAQWPSDSSIALCKYRRYGNWPAGGPGVNRRGRFHGHPGETIFREDPGCPPHALALARLRGSATEQKAGFRKTGERDVWRGTRRDGYRRCRSTCLIARCGQAFPFLKWMAARSAMHEKRFASGEPARGGVRILLWRNHRFHGILLWA